MLLPPSCHVWFDDNGLPLSRLCRSIPDKMTALLIDKRREAIWRMSVDFLFDTKGLQLSHMSGCWKHLNLKLGFVYLNTDKSGGILYLQVKGGRGFTLFRAFKARDVWFLWLEDPRASYLLVGGNTMQNNTVHWSRGWINQDNKNKQMSHFLTLH